MLVKYKPVYKKIAMGLISYMPNAKEIKILQETIERYETDDAWQLFLWKEEDIVGVAGVHILDEQRAELCHLSVNPSFRDEGIGKTILAAIREKIGMELLPTKDTESFFKACEHSGEEDCS